MPAMENIAGNLFLIGLMGAGKTTLGRHIAQMLNRPFYDSDQEICRRTGVSVPTIFELEGEQGFRDRETAVINELSALDNIVLATGGGAVLREENRRRLRERGTVVYLHACPEVLIERTRCDTNRPLLQVADPLAKLRELYNLRDSVYRSAAHIIIEANRQSCHKNAEYLLQAWAQPPASSVCNDKK
ncbi:MULTISPECIES: shikimate kinase [unclassified Neisseria]|uniref:shikimate kinase n=1 Tax=unclassified Neisseria TaxID=2623750 RepID=UPI001071769E|nr:MULTISPECIES: shikimate kinase [unclassified Neisseria]MBF0803502.1 shikimate kinase [Neisseria sp. 19428wB4_WF04]TFU43820.1 shikimate kinase [Neisseria sp. WF04]